ncbi:MULTISPECIES: ABC transporter ATP-binding protein [Clostridium]|nr:MULTISPECIES: ABC transporter ATP-binding protein [Clostridium]MDU1349846.1 ABC transporter ATP-binding protein [Clostridium argentinense]
MRRKNMKEIVINIENLKKSYGDYVAVNDISFEIKAGEIFGLLGPNGAGKTSILECIEGIRTPDGGKIDVGGYNPRVDSKKMHEILGVQLQSSGLPLTMTVKEAIDMFSNYHKVSPNHEIISKMGLKNKLNKKYRELSGGEKRRLILALAIMHKPKILILDEPTAALDVQSRVDLHEVMKTLRDNGTAILLATHDMAEAEKLCNRIAIILKGKIIKIGTPNEITSSGSNISKISVRTVNDSLKETDAKFEDDYYIYNSKDPGEKVNEIINTINSKGDSLVDLRIERQSLEEKFIELTSEGRN